MRFRVQQPAFLHENAWLFFYTVQAIDQEYTRTSPSSTPLGDTWPRCQRQLVLLQSTNVWGWLPGLPGIPRRLRVDWNNFILEQAPLFLLRDSRRRDHDSSPRAVFWVQPRKSTLQAFVLRSSTSWRWQLGRVSSRGVLLGGVLGMLAMSVGVTVVYVGRLRQTCHRLFVGLVG